MLGCCFFKLGKILEVLFHRRRKRNEDTEKGKKVLGGEGVAGYLRH